MRTTERPRQWPGGLGVVLFVLASIPAAAGEPSARDLIALAPEIRSSDPKIRSIEIAGFHQQDGKITDTFRALYRAPDHFAFVVRDGREGTPISYAVDRRTFVYDPERPQFLVFDGESSYRKIAVVDGDGLDSWGMSESRKKVGEITVDLKAIFGQALEGPGEPETTVVKTGERCYTLTTKHPSSYRRSRIDLARPIPFTSFELAKSPRGAPFLCVDKIAVDGPIDDREFVFPSAESLAEILHVDRIQDGLVAQAKGFAAMCGVVNARAEAYAPPNRFGMIAPRLRAARSRGIAENDSLYARRIDALIPSDKVEHVLQAGRADDPGTIQRTAMETIRDHLPHLPFKVRVSVK